MNLTAKTSETPSSFPQANLRVISEAHLQIRKEQIQLLYHSSLSAAAASAFAAGILAYMQWPVINHMLIIIWLVCMILVLGARVISYFTFLRADSGLCKIKTWENLSVFIAVLAALEWGVAGIILFPEGSFERQAGIIVILAGMAAGAATTLSALRKPVFIFIPITMLPLTVHLFAEPTQVRISLGILCVVYTVFLLNVANRNYKTHKQNITLRIKSRKSEETVLKTAEILKLIASGKPANYIYNAIAHLYESRYPGLRCSMLILKGNTLFHGGAPSLPEAYCNAVNGLKIGPAVGSCGTSTYSGERVLVEDIATDPKWAALKDIALPHGLRSCWSEAIKDPSGKVLGAFGMYYNHPALPNDDELADLEAAAQLAGIVMVREQGNAQLSKLSNSLNQSAEAVVITDAEGTIEYVNPSYVNISGYSDDELLSRKLWDFASDSQDDDFQDKLWKTLCRGMVWTGKVIEKRKDGSLYPAHLKISPVKDDAGAITNFIASHSDLSEFQRLEGQILQSEKMASIGQLAAGVAHEINNPIGFIKSNLNSFGKYIGQLGAFIEKQEQAITDHEKEQALEKIAQLRKKSKVDFILEDILDLQKESLDGIDRVSKIVQDLKSFSRVNLTEFESVDLNKCIESTLNIVSNELKYKATLKTDLAPLPLVSCYPQQISQVLLNLFVNAGHAIEKQGIISIRSWQEDNMVCLSVSDTGSGIAEADLKHLFEPFFTTKEVGKGTGLGLSISYEIIKKHEGNILVETKIGHGTTFTIQLPLDNA